MFGWKRITAPNGMYVEMKMNRKGIVSLRGPMEVIELLVDMASLPMAILAKMCPADETDETNEYKIIGEE